MLRHFCPDLGPLRHNSDQLQHRALATWYIGDWWHPSCSHGRVQKKEPAAWSHEDQHLRSTAVWLWKYQRRGAQTQSEPSPSVKMLVHQEATDGKIGLYQVSVVREWHDSVQQSLKTAIVYPHLILWLESTRKILCWKCYTLSVLLLPSSSLMNFFCIHPF